MNPDVSYYITHAAVFYNRAHGDTMEPVMQSVSFLAVLEADVTASSGRCHIVYGKSYCCILELN